MIRKRYSMLYAGFLILLFDVHWQGVDVLPDGIGYLLLVFGLHSFRPLDVRFRRAQGLAAVLAPLSLLLMFQRALPCKAAENTAGWLRLLTELVVLCLLLVMVQAVLKGLAVLSATEGRQDLVREAHGCWVQYLALTVLGSIVSMVGVWPEHVLVPAIVLMVASLIVAVQLLGFLRRVDVAHDISEHMELTPPDNQPLEDKVP